jgi:hypothetical protein
VINALLMLAALGIGFGGSPWPAFAICGTLIVALGIPHQREVLRRYTGQPKTDIVLAMLFEVCAALAGAFASAWVGYGLRVLFTHVLVR